MEQKLTLRKTPKETYLIQRLNKKDFPSQKNLDKEFVSFLERRDYDFKKAIKYIVNHDYMGSAEFEWGLVPEAYDFIMEQAKNQNLINNADYFDTDDIKTRIYFICPTQYEQHVHRCINDILFNKKQLKEPSELLENVKGTDYGKKFIGWLEIDNGFMLFTDVDVFVRFCLLFNLDVSLYIDDVSKETLDVIAEKEHFDLRNKVATTIKEEQKILSFESKFNPTEEEIQELAEENKEYLNSEMDIADFSADIDADQRRLEPKDILDEIDEFFHCSKCGANSNEACTCDRDFRYETESQKKQRIADANEMIKSAENIIEEMEEEERINKINERVQEIFDKSFMDITSHLHPNERILGKTVKELRDKVQKRINDRKYIHYDKLPTETKEKLRESSLEHLSYSKNYEEIYHSNHNKKKVSPLPKASEFIEVTYRRNSDGQICTFKTGKEALDGISNFCKKNMGGKFISFKFI